MIVGTPTTASATVAAPASAPAVASAVIVGSGAVATASATVARSLRDSYDSPWIGTRVSVVIDGVAVLPDELDGPVTIVETLGRPVSASLGLLGARWSASRTVRTWTRVPVVLTLWQGTPTASSERVYHLLVRTCKERHTEGGPAIALELGDQWALVDRYLLCHEVPPLSGLTTGAIVSALCAAAGVTVVCPPGRPYYAPLQAINQRLLAALEPLFEREGWAPVFRGSTLHVVPVSTIPAPLPPDHVWTAADLYSLTSAPPVDPPSRHVVRGQGVRYVDEAGIEVTTTVTEVRAPYSPRVAVSVQGLDGSLSATGAVAAEPEVRVVSWVEVTQRTSGGKLLDLTTRERAWYNPAAAVLTSGSSPGTGAGPDGWGYAVAYVDADGAYRAWPVERFVEVSLQRQVPEYSETGSVLRQVTDAHRWNRRLRASRTDADPPAVPTIAHTAVGDDDQSYAPRSSGGGVILLEEYELAERHETTFDYGAAGAVLSETQDSYGYRALSAAVDGAVGNYVRYDGTGQTTLEATWGLVEQQVRGHVVSTDGHLRGTLTRRFGYQLPTKADGEYDLGNGERSARTAATWGLIDSTSEQFTAVGSTQVQADTLQAGRRETRLLVGPAPLARFEDSPWTSLVTEPIELIQDDDTVASWFGVSAETIDNPAVQSLDEAEGVALRRRAERLATVFDFERPDTPAEVGETVLLVWPGQPAVRARIDVLRRTRNPQSGEAILAGQLKALWEDG